MRTVHVARAVVAVLVTTALSASASAQLPRPPAEPPTPTEVDRAVQTGQGNEDAARVPSSPGMVERMLDLARVTVDDFVVDLESGDGRHIIAAAMRGARGLGIERDAGLVAVARKLAVEAGVDPWVTFVQADDGKTDISQATVVALFLSPDDLEDRLDTLLALRPGTRIVVNTFAIPDWQPEAQYEVLDDCGSQCVAFLHVVPAVVAGAWRLDDDSEMILSQTFQMVRGVLGRTRDPIYGRLKGAEITFTAGKATYAGLVNDDRITGTVTEAGAAPRPWSAIQLR